ncbi:MAG: hypothetical protein ABIA62_05065 [Candidatus Woesearchaeota archaeon]
MGNKDIVYDFLVRLYDRYPIEQQLHMTVSSHLEDLCDGTDPDEREEIFSELEEAYQFRHGMERCAYRLRMLQELIQSSTEPELMIRDIKEFKQEFVLFEECRRYGSELIGLYIARVEAKQGEDEEEDEDPGQEDEVDVVFEPDGDWDLDFDDEKDGGKED